MERYSADATAVMTHAVCARSQAGQSEVKPATDGIRVDRNDLAATDGSGNVDSFEQTFWD